MPQVQQPHVGVPLPEFFVVINPGDAALYEDGGAAVQASLVVASCLKPAGAAEAGSSDRPDGPSGCSRACGSAYKTTRRRQRQRSTATSAPRYRTVPLK